MDTKSKEQEVVEQITEMLRDIGVTATAKIKNAISAAPEEYLQPGNYLLAKAILDSIMRERPYSGLNPRTQKEFNNIHACI